MAFYRGEEGSVKFKNGTGTVGVVASTTGWSLSISKDTIDCTAQGDTARSYVGSFTSGSGSVDLLFTVSTGETGELIEDALTATDPADAQFELYLGDGTKKITFNGIVTSTDFGTSSGDIQSVSVGFQASGAINTTAL